MFLPTINKKVKKGFRWSKTITVKALPEAGKPDNFQVQ
jgi:hypothetical protein